MKTLITSRIVATCLLTAAIAAGICIKGIRLMASNSAASNSAQKGSASDDRLVVHEWGTFTSIAGKDGFALDWRPLNGPTDLPKFVHTIQDVEQGLRHRWTKRTLEATVRMETPVLYFYSANQRDVEVSVAFPQGKVTEWYPQARSVATGVDWGRVKVMPGAAVSLPVEDTASHYYPARETDAAPVQVCGSEGRPTQQEKFLFYRGVGTFDLPLSVKLEDEKVVLKNLGKDEIAHLIIFENRGGKIGYQLVDAFTGELTYDRPTPDRNLDSLLQDLKQTLVSSGLYVREAEAMIKTWRSSWFEEGMRVFYILPRLTTDTILPLKVEPRPAEIVRVLVGRTEVITPEMEKSVQRQVDLLGNPSARVQKAALQNLRRYGRFSEPIIRTILEKEGKAGIRERLRQLIEKPGENTE